MTKIDDKPADNGNHKAENFYVPTIFELCLLPGLPVGKASEISRHAFGRYGPDFIIWAFADLFRATIFPTP
jgi:hypothetical protein